MNMKRIKIILSALVLTCCMSSCTMTRPYAATNNDVGDGTGTSETILIFGMSAGDILEQGLFSTNKNFGVIQAARNGNIDKIGCVDVQTTNFLFITKVKIIVSGTEE